MRTLCSVASIKLPVEAGEKASVWKRANAREFVWRANRFTNSAAAAHFALALERQQANHIPQTTSTTIGWQQSELICNFLAIAHTTSTSTSTGATGTTLGSHTTRTTAATASQKSNRTAGKEADSGETLASKWTFLSRSLARLRATRRRARGSY